MYMNMKYLLLVLTVAINGISFAYNYDLDNPNYKITQSKNSKANCAPASARLTMQYNDVSALLETGGMMFMDRANNVGAYIVPKNDNVNASIYPNPIQDKINISLPYAEIDEKIKIEIFDLNGRVIFSEYKTANKNNIQCKIMIFNNRY